MVQLNIILASCFIFPVFSFALSISNLLTEKEQLSARGLDEAVTPEQYIREIKEYNEARDFEDLLEERDWHGFKKRVKGAVKHAGKIASGPVGKAAATSALRILSNGGSLSGRELEDMDVLYVRDLEEALYRRDWEEFDERKLNELDELD